MVYLLNILFYMFIAMAVGVVLVSPIGCQQEPISQRRSTPTIDPVMPAEKACTIIKHEDFTQVYCADGTEEIIEHNPGVIEEIPTETEKEQIPEVCTVIPVDVGAEIQCSDGSSVVIRNGTDGIDGKDGEDGVDGKDGKDGQDGEQGELGETGAAGKDGNDGRDGVDGKDGEAGQDGMDALPCTVTDHEEGGIITCPDGSEVLIKDGKVLIKPGKGGKK